MPYRILYREQAEKYLVHLAINEPKALKKAQRLIEELKEAPPNWGWTSRATAG